MTQEELLDKPKEKRPHFLGHRARLREKLLERGATSLADYELLEMLLFSAIVRGDTKPIAKALLRQFGNFSKVLNATDEELYKVEGVGEAVIASLRVAREMMERALREEVIDRPVIQSWSALLDYAKATMAYKTIEEFRILFLNRRNELIRDEVQQRGTIDHTPIYTREVVKRALELGAASIILMHNHPSGDPKPSKADIDITRQVMDAVKVVGISVHDHIIISERGHFSFKGNGVI